MAMHTNVCRDTLRHTSGALLILLVAVLQGRAQEGGTTAPVKLKPPEVTIPNTELRTIRSRIIEQEFDIYVQLPPNYVADTATTYPVLYMIDANRAFPMVANIASVLTFPKGDLPEIIIVGIGYPIHDMLDWAALRTRDLTPTNDTGVDNYWNRLLTRTGNRNFEVKSGGASRFLEFIIKELIPFVESKYRVSRTDRGLAGYSYGGLFALYALFTHPEAFVRYFAGSPSVEFDHGVVFRYEKESTSSERRLQAKIFLSVGGLEDSTTITGTTTMARMLHARYGDGVSWQMFDGENHRSCMAPAIMRAIRVLYKQ